LSGYPLPQGLQAARPNPEVVRAFLFCFVFVLFFFSFTLGCHHDVLVKLESLNDPKNNVRWGFGP
jgi:hypothetical protein